MSDTEKIEPFDVGTAMNIPQDLQQWADALLDYNAETYDPMLVLERLTEAESKLAAKDEEIKTLQSLVPPQGDGSCAHCGAVPSIPLGTSLCNTCLDVMIGNSEAATQREDQLKAQLSQAQERIKRCDELERRIETLIGVTCEQCERGDKLFVEPSTKFYTHRLGGNYCSAHQLHSLLDTKVGQEARALLAARREGQQ